MIEKEQGAGSMEHGAGQRELESGVQSLDTDVARFAFLAFSLQPSAFSFSFLLFASISLLSLCFSLASCGHKTPIRPPEWVSPEAIDDLALDIDSKKNVVVVTWGRPTKYVDDSEMDDLGGFTVLRATQKNQEQESAFTQVATITVTDRDRFRKAKKFTYTDTQLSPGVLYRYRVLAMTLDGYSSGMSNTVEVVWRESPAVPPASAPAPAPAPASRPKKR